MIYEAKIPLQAPPDDLTIPQFILDTIHPKRPRRPTNHPWLIDDRTGRSYGLEDCRERTHGLTNALHARFKLAEDQVAVIFSPNHLDYPIAIWACHRLGAICSGANPTYTSSELTYQLQTTRAKLLVTHPASLEVATKAAKEAGLPSDRIILLSNNLGTSIPTGNFKQVNDLIEEGLGSPMGYTERKLKKGEAKTKLAFLSFSSGTTGKPKAVAIPHSSLISNVLQMSAHNRVGENYAPFEKRRFRPGDVCLGVLPFYHIYGLVVNLHWIMFSAISVVVVPKFDFEGMLKSIERYRMTHLMLVPPHIVLMVKHPATSKYNLSSLRYIMVGAAPLSTELTQQFWKKFPSVKIGQGYGMTETSTTVIMNPLEHDNGIPGSAGTLIPGTIAKLIKSDGKLAKPGEAGELMVKGPQNAVAYLGNKQATKETFIDGWVKTGDEGLIDEDGNFYVTDRIKEIFKVKGFQVAPAELEGHILEHPAVADCAVIGLPDAYSGEVPLAYVTLNAEAAKKIEAEKGEAEKIKESIKKHVSDHKVRYKWLEGGVEFIDAIPKNPSGKLLRRVLRDQAKDLIKKREGGEGEFKLRAKL